jgi:hypothetical protein
VEVIIVKKNEAYISWSGTPSAARCIDYEQLRIKANKYAAEGKTVSRSKYTRHRRAPGKLRPKNTCMEIRQMKWVFNPELTFVDIKKAIG